jgi:hypothetical protein
VAAFQVGQLLTKLADAKEPVQRPSGQHPVVKTIVGFGTRRSTILGNARRSHQNRDHAPL